MRFVDNGRIKRRLGEEWGKRASDALAEACACSSDQERRAVLKRRAEVWREATTTLSDRTDGLCWYCGVRQVRSDNAVDHFRPKGRVAEESTHPGYWWLAFDHDNFRYSCTFCNSRRVDTDGGTDGGKQDHFPLLDGSTRARCETDDLSRERPVLLDPCCASDPSLLSFRRDGRPTPARAQEVDPEAFQRAEVSIHLYHLDHAELVEERTEIWNRIDGLVERGTRCQEEAMFLKDIKDDILVMLRPSEPLNRVARLAIRAHRGTPWVADWLEEVETTL